MNKKNKFPLCTLCLCETFIILLLLCFLAAALAYAEDWYISNASGLALEKTSSKTSALSAEYALSVAKKTADDIPENLRRYYEDGFSVETRVLYKKGKGSRQQWIFRDGSKTTRLNASYILGDAEKKADSENNTETGSAVQSANGITAQKIEEIQNEAERLPFIEIFDDSGSIISLIRIGKNDVSYGSTFQYRNGLLVKSETKQNEELLWTDVYKYSRKNKLRLIERLLPKRKETTDNTDSTDNADSTNSTDTVEAAEAEAPPAEIAEILSIRFPPPVTFISLDSPYDHSLRTGALKDVFALRSARIVYNADNLGRIQREERLDEEGSILAEIANEWKGERIKKITWKAGGNSGEVEFEYDDKDERISEKDFRNGLLERTVSKDGDREIEELYLEGKVVLRAYWEGGRKVSEERYSE